MWKPALINEGLRLVHPNYTTPPKSKYDWWKPALINEGLRRLKSPQYAALLCQSIVETCPH